MPSVLVFQTTERSDTEKRFGKSDIILSSPFPVVFVISVVNEWFQVSSSKFQVERAGMMPALHKEIRVYHAKRVTSQAVE